MTHTGRVIDSKCQLVKNLWYKMKNGGRFVLLHSICNLSLVVVEIRCWQRFVCTHVRYMCVDLQHTDQHTHTHYHHRHYHHPPPFCFNRCTRSVPRKANSSFRHVPTFLTNFNARLNWFWIISLWLKLISGIDKNRFCFLGLMLDEKRLLSNS